MGSTVTEQKLSSLGTKWPCKKSMMIVAVVVIIICVSIGVGVGIHVFQTKEKGSTSTVTNTESTTPSKCPWFLKDSPLILISIGGFRSDYLSRNITPTINKLSRLGVSTPYMMSVNPTLTLPNLYSIVTGLYPESHGIVHNTFIDPTTNTKFDIKDPDSLTDSRWWKGEPIWVTLGRQNKTTATIGWPGADVKITNFKPIVFQMNASQNAVSAPVQQIFRWLNQSSNQRPSLILWYIDHAVKTTQTFGPNSPLVNDKLTQIDGAIYDLWSGLKQKSLSECVNLVIVSDHGMSVTSSERILNFNSLIPSQKWSVFGNAFSVIQAKRKMASTEVEDLASSLECSKQNVKVFTKSVLPKRYHVFNSPRSGDLIMLANDRWLSSRSWDVGSSGYDNRYSSMQALFMAVGPGFRDHLRIEPFENIELYNMMSELLKVEPAKNNGTEGSLYHVLNSSKSLLEEFKARNDYERLENWTLVKSYLDETPCSNETSMGRSVVSILKRALENKADILLKHLPMGPPTGTGNENCYRLLYQTDFVVGTKNHHFLPLWCSTTLNKRTKWRDQSSEPKLTNCVFTDARLSVENRINGFQNNQDIGYLYNIDFIDVREAYLSSNAVPMFKEFRNGIWKFLWKTLKQYSKSENINVVVGPVFDNNHDGIADNTDSSNPSKPLFPSHFFIVLSKCHEEKTTNMSDCLIKDKLDVLSFVVPHRRKIDNCMSYTDFLQEHIVRIRDIELLTDLRFFESYRDHLAVVRRRVFLSASLWPSSNTETWLKQPCLLNRRSSRPRDAPLLLISLSGFSPSHFSLSRTPVLDKIRTCGVQSKHMRPVYPSNTLPNAYSIVTGLYPESHGLLSKYIYNNKMKQEPIWLTAEKQNKRTVVLGWPGLEASFKDTNQSTWIASVREIGFNKRIRKVLDWLSLSADERPDFICMNFGEPDLTAHKYGANSHKIENALTSIDEFMGQLMNGIKERNLEDCVNLIVLSDHGMQSTSIKRTGYLDDTNTDSFIREGATVFQRAGFRQVEVNEKLKSIHCTGAHVRSYTRATLPRRFHFTKSTLIGDVILILEDGWLIKTKYKRPKSAHGYDNRFKSMQSIFLAYGPSFKNNMTIEPFDNIEVYNLLTGLLRIKPVQNNGTDGSLDKLLKNPWSTPEPSTSGEDCPYSETNQTDPTRINHVPFGDPSFPKTGNFCLFHTEAFTQGRSNDLNMPLWVSYNLPQKNSSNVTDFDPSGCSSFDNANLNLTTGNLFISGEQYGSSSSAVPMFKGFKEGVWQKLSKLVNEYAVKYKRLNIISGPIFEPVFPGINRSMTANCSVQIPTHFYVILAMFCSANEVRPCKETSVEVLPFILPHVEKDQNCLKPREYFIDHAARIRDIEQLTGLTFLTGLSWQDSVRIRTYLPLEMWEGLRPSSWMKLPQCINLDNACKNSNRPVLLVSLDGFRSDYTKYNVTPVINRLRQCGIQTPFMQSAFPSKTFPNHYTIATGLYPESHGIVGNYMYDMERDQVFTMASTQPFWWGGEPIWKTVIKAGKESASYFFVGSSISGVNATYYYPFSMKTPYEKRVDQTVSWLKQGIPFVSTYFEEPDSTGHREGPSSKQIMNALRLIDSYIGRLMDKLYEENLHNCVNIIILADHGMADVNCKRSVALWDIIDKEIATKDMFVYSDGRVSNKYWQERKTFHQFTDGKYGISRSDLMSKLECASPHMRVFQKEFLPKRFHYAKHKRIGEIQLLLDDEWLFHRKNKYCGNRGSHGYDNSYKSMNALFLAYGPDLKQQLKIESFQNIEIYNLIADMVNVTAAPNNGTNGRLHGLMRRPPPEPLRRPVGQYKIVDFNMSHADLAIFLKQHKCLNFTPTNKEVSLLHASLVDSNKLTFQENISFGLPLLKNNMSIQLLRHRTHLTAYDSIRSSPLFILATRTTVSQQQITNYPDAGNGCMTDPRMPQKQLNYDSTESAYTWLSLAQIDVGTNQKEIPYLTTSFIRVTKAFKKYLWNEVLKILQEWQELFAMSSWFVGPIYDYDLDGRADNADTIKRFTNDSLPTHVFLVLVACRDTGEIETTTAYIIPSNQQHLPKCRRMSQLVRDHQTRVRDVELLTNMEFFPKERFTDAVIHRTSMIDFNT